jgi:chromosome segregation ATPase
MNKVYLIAPIAGLALFAGLYPKSARDFNARIAETDRRAKLDADEKTARQKAAEAKARADAAVAAEKRKQELADKQRADDARRQARTDAEERRNAARDEVQNLRTQLKHLLAELTAERDAAGRSEKTLLALQQEEQRVRDSVQLAAAQHAATQALAERINASQPQFHFAGVSPRATR